MVRVEGVSKSYGKRQALSEVTLRVERGEIFALLGPNGAGKTTLLKAMVGLLFPTRGHVLIDGHDLASERREALRLMGFVPQRVTFPPHLSVEETLAFFAGLKELPPAAIERALGHVGLLAEARRQVGELSGGTQQRLGLAQALLAEPPLLVLDEPTVGLDPQVSLEFLTLLTALNARGTTIVLSSHLLGEVERLASRVAILKDGAVAASDSVSHLLSASGLPSYLWVKTAQGASSSQRALQAAGIAAERVGGALRLAARCDNSLALLDAIRREGLDIEAFWTSTPSLEEVFRWVVERKPGP